jgi:hypothetical protein
MTAPVKPSSMLRAATLEAKSRDHDAGFRTARTRSDADESAGTTEVIRSRWSRSNSIEEATTSSSPRLGSPSTEVAEDREAENTQLQNRQPENGQPENRQPENRQPLDAPKARDAIRSKAFLKATIRFQNRNVTLDCVVRNMSLSGARLEIGQTFALPAEFELEVPQRGVVFQCALKWRNEHAAGVKFKDSESQTTSLSTRSMATLDELQQENAELRREVAFLGARLREIDGSTA